MSLIPANRPVLGEDLDTLRESLALISADACWVFGTSTARWASFVRESRREPVNSGTIALLARAIDTYPGCIPMPPVARPDDVYAAVSVVMPGLDKRRLAVMFGREQSSGYRWMLDGSKISNTLSRLLAIFLTAFRPAAAVSGSDAREMLDWWNELVMAEARARGVPDVFESGRWGGVAEAGGDAMRGEDIETLREQLGLTVGDVCFLLGMDMTSWMRVVKKGAKAPIKDATLAVLVRLLRERPKLAPMPPSPSAQEVYDAIRAYVPELDKKRFGIMFGRESTSGYRWLTRGSPVGAEQERIFSVFMNALRNAEQSVPEGDKKGRAVHALAMLFEWDRMVKHEAQQRGLFDIFLTGRWVVRESRDGTRRGPPLEPNKVRRREFSPRLSGTDQFDRAAARLLGDNMALASLVSGNAARRRSRVTKALELAGKGLSLENLASVPEDGSTKGTAGVDAEREYKAAVARVALTRKTVARPTKAAPGEAARKSRAGAKKRATA